MTTRQEVRVPDIGDFDEVEIVEVMVAVGDEISAEDSLVTLETDKAAMDVPAVVAGTIESVLVKVGDIVVFGQYAGSNTIEIDGEELIIMGESEIFGVVE